MKIIKLKYIILIRIQFFPKMLFQYNKEQNALKLKKTTKIKNSRV